MPNHGANDTHRRHASVISRRFGHRVRQARIEKGYTQEKLADLSRIHVTYLSSLERGHRNPSLNVVDALARGLNCTLAELFEGVE